MESGERSDTMVTMTCPWCEADLPVEASGVNASEVTCDGCSTSWLTTEPSVEELALAA